MKDYIFISFLIITIFGVFISKTNSASQVMPNISGVGASGKTSSFKSSFSDKQVGFGGKILSTKIPGVECLGQPFIMAGLLSSMYRNSQSNFSVSDLKNYMPYVIKPEDMQDPIKAGGQILGKFKLTPDMKTCFIPGPTPIYIPSLTVKTYGAN